MASSQTTLVALIVSVSLLALPQESHCRSLLDLMPQAVMGATHGQSANVGPVPAELPATRSGFAATNVFGMQMPSDVFGLQMPANLSQSLLMLRKSLRGQDDVFTSASERLEEPAVGTGFAGFFDQTAASEWIILSVVVLGLLLFDFFVLRQIKNSDCRTNVAVLVFWLTVAAAYNAGICVRLGESAGITWCSGYLLEWLLSMDNLFVFHLIFRVYKTPPSMLHKALFWGIMGAVVFRMLFFMMLSSLMHLIHWMRFVFGAILIYSGVQAARAEEEEDSDPTDAYAVRFLKWCLGDSLDDKYDEAGQSLLVWEGPRLRATLLVPVIFCLELTDILFAVDSVSAKVAQIPDSYLCYSSSVLAIFGLRSMFFIVRDLVDYFDLLKYGLCFILVFIGAELMISDYVQLPSHTVLVIIVSVFVLCAMASTAKHVRSKKMGDSSDIMDLKGPQLA